MSLLDDVLARVKGLGPEDRAALVDSVAPETSQNFIPNPGPQTDAWFCRANTVLYGGSGGGGKSALIAGKALYQHRRSLIVRKHYADLEKGGGLIDEVLKFHGSRDGFSGGGSARLRFGDDKVVTFAGVANPGDEFKFQGQPRDLLAVDEATQISEHVVRFLMGWVRSEVPGQRTQTLLATNPPLDNTGDWVIGMFRPWLDLTHPKPAAPGELRWFVVDPDGRDFEVSGPEPHHFPGHARPVLPQSRTFIPAKLDDNPFLLHDSGYRATQDSLPEPLRSAIRDGNFMLARQDDEYQVIPTDWIRQAQARWTPDPPSHAPMSAIAVDPAQGGADHTVISSRYDGWFAPLIAVPGVETPTGNEVAGLIVAHRRNAATVIVDMGGGYGGATALRLKDSGIDVMPYKGASAISVRTNDQAYGFHNTRAAAYWRFREALDPSQDGGSPVALPDDPELVSDLTALRFEIGPRGIKITPKDKIVEKLGRSPDRGDAVVMCNFYGPRWLTHGSTWRGYANNSGPNSKSKVIQNRMAARRKR